MNLKSFYYDAICDLHVSISELASNGSNTFLCRTLFLKVWLRHIICQDIYAQSLNHECTIYSFSLICSREVIDSQLRSIPFRSIGMKRVASHCGNQLCVRPWSSTVEAEKLQEGFTFRPQQHCHHLVALIHAATAWDENVQSHWQRSRDKDMCTHALDPSKLQNSEQWIQNITSLKGKLCYYWLEPFHIKLSSITAPQIALLTIAM